jgi:hypothetical protein
MKPRFTELTPHNYDCRAVEIVDLADGPSVAALVRLAANGVDGRREGALRRIERAIGEAQSETTSASSTEMAAIREVEPLPIKEGVARARTIASKHLRMTRSSARRP